MAIDTIGSMMLRNQVTPQGAAERADRADRAGMGVVPGTAGAGSVQPHPGVDTVDFSDALERALGRVGEAQATADTKTMALLTGQDMPIHEVMIAVTEAELAVQMTTAIATKAIQAYQEIWRMEV